MAASIWRGRITFGLVSIPVRLVKAARRERTRFRRVQRVRPESPAIEDEAEDEAEVAETPAQPSKVVKFPSGKEDAGPAVRGDPGAFPPAGETVVRVRNAPVSGLTDAPVNRTEILKGYEVAKDEFVVLAPEEVAALRPRTSSELEIEAFVKVEEIDPIYYETSYYVIPESGAERAYALLFAALKETGHAGMGVFAMHGREHVALIRAGEETLVLHSMFYANEVGIAAYRVGSDGANPKEVGLAKMLVGALEAKFEPERWKDRYEEHLRALIESRTPTAATSPHPSKEQQAPIPDIMAALRKSLEMARKPVAREQRPAKAKRQPAKEK
jgi:DNA end-binding protein Ku